MYERFYNLRERPFSLSPDPEYLYLSRVHREALDSLRYGIESSAGFIVVTGEIGAGKTTLLQALVRRLDERTITGRIVSTTLNPRELLEAIALEFGLDVAGKSKPLLIRDLSQFLVEQRSQGRRPLLMIDEAQNLSARGLEEVRLLSNLETEKSKLLQILIVGQPNLRELLSSPELTQFHQRVAVRYHLSALDEAETSAYIDFRLSHAAIAEPLRFPREAAALVHRRSGGVPRLINVICDAALVYGYAEDRPDIDRSLIQETIGELEASGILSAPAGSIAATVVAPPAPAPLAAADTPSTLPAAATAGEPGDTRHAETPSSTTEIAARITRLEERERAFALRERELAEQARILTEQYRTLRDVRAQTAATTRASEAVSASPGASTFKLDGIRRGLRRALSRTWLGAVEDN
jgi:putative secretion ATPase (PEP-CTERM system associated)